MSAPLDRHWRYMSETDKNEVIEQATRSICDKLKDQENNPMSQMLDRDYQEGGDHYARLHIQPWDVIDQGPVHEAIGFYRGNALKYLMRFGSKLPLDAGAPLEDAKKARHYLEKLIDVLGG